VSHPASTSWWRRRRSRRRWGRGRFHFPDPREATRRPAGHRGDLEPATLLAAYRQGVFPWPAADSTLWWSPDPRAVLPPDGVHVSRSLARRLPAAASALTNRRRVRRRRRRLRRPPRRRRDVDHPAIRDAYARLHRLGWAAQRGGLGSAAPSRAGSMACRSGRSSRRSRCSTG